MKNKDYNDELWDEWKDDQDAEKMMKAEIYAFLIVMGFFALIVFCIAMVNGL